MSTLQQSFSRKRSAWLFAIIVMVIVCSICCKQPGKNQDTKESLLITGKVTGYLSNRIGDADKILITANGQEQIFHFPPFAAKQIMHLAPANTILKVTAAPNKKKPGNELQQINIGDQVLMIDAIPPPIPAANKTIELSSKANHYKLDDHGHISGIIIDSFLIDIPPPIIKNLEPLLKPSVTILVKGYRRNELDGFVNNTGLLLVKPFSISIDKTTYLL